MTIRNLEFMFEPRSVVLIGASPDEASVGYKIARNLIDAKFSGRLAFVNPKHREILGIPCHGSVADLAETPDLGIISVPPSAVPGVIADLGAKGTRAAIVITAGLGAVTKDMLEAGRKYCLRVLGPNCLGLMLPHFSLNASFAHRNALAGDLAFISQSGALLTTVVDWASSRNIGFSHVVSLGEMADVDFGDVVDYLAADARSRALLLYMESVTGAAKFMSAARRAARIKPVIVVKSGRHEAGAKAAFSHTGALAGLDAAYDAAFRRTGLLRVRTLDDLFAAAEMLSRTPRLKGERLAILTNGGGAGVLAADELQDAGGELATLNPSTMAKLNSVLPKAWSHANPVDIIGDATPDRFRHALEALLHDDKSDAVLVIQCPTAMISSTDAANAIIEVAQSQPRDAVKPILTNWLGGETPREGRALFASHGIPTFETTSEAVSGYMQLARHGRAQRELMRTPPARHVSRLSDPLRVERQIAAALAQGRRRLTAIESADILDAYGIPFNKATIAKDFAGVTAAAEAILSKHQACVVKIVSPDITHKSDVGGVRLALGTAASAEQAAREMAGRVRNVMSSASIEGFAVEPMVRRPTAHETLVGVTVDPTFGPMILFGAGGTAVEILKDRALGFPPLDTLLARQMISETRISRLLAGYRDRPGADLNALADVLVRVSDLVIRHPEIRELDINPLLVDEHGVVGIDARIRIDDNQINPRQPLSIRPYPETWERHVVLPMGKIQIRPVLPEDEALYRRFFAHVSASDIRLRFFTARRTFSHEFIAPLTQIDYAREMAFLALSPDGSEMLGVARIVLTPDRDQGEFGVLVRSDLKGQGIGWQLMNLLIAYARAEGVKKITGLVMPENTTMLQMAEDLGFEISNAAQDPSMKEAVLIFRGISQPRYPVNKGI